MVSNIMNRQKLDVTILNIHIKQTVMSNLQIDSGISTTNENLAVWKSNLFFFYFICFPH